MTDFHDRGPAATAAATGCVAAAGAGRAAAAVFEQTGAAPACTPADVATLATAGTPAGVTALAAATP